MKYLLPIILLAASAGLFFVYINPSYLEIKDLREQENSFSEALSNSKKLEAIRDTLVKKYNDLATTVSLDRIKKFLPDNVDNIKLVLEINRVAEQYNMLVKNIKYDVPKKEAPAGNQFVAQAPTGPVKDYDGFDLQFSVEGSYGNFVNFLESLEKSLRIVDLGSISFSSTEAFSPSGAPTDRYKYDIKIKTYWLKG